jgi:phenylacetate-CoA ligase
MRRWLAWNVGFRLQERAKGHATFKILKEMEAADQLSATELEELGNERLGTFINYCYAHVPYVRTRMQIAGVEPAQIRKPEDLALLPLMTKTDVREHRNSLRSDLAGKLSSFSTGGSTGTPLVFDISKRRVASRVACRQRVARWWGLSVGDSELALWGAPLELTRQDWIRSLRDRLLSSQLLSAYEMNDSTMSVYLDIIERQRFRQIFAYPSAIYLLCLHARKQGRNLRRLGIKVVFVTSEVLYPHQRDLISETFNCPVANGYGGRDSGFIAHECPQGGMHLLADTIITEIVDSRGRQVQPGETGEIVVTDLYSQEAPFLRYATGDIGVASKRRCPCGRALPLLESIDGRSNDSVVAPDGRVMHGQALISLLMEIDGIEQFRIYQKKPDSLHVQIVRSERFRTENEDKIRRGWAQRLRAPLHVTFEYVPNLPQERSGKVRHIVSELPAGRTRMREEDHFMVRPQAN